MCAGITPQDQKKKLLTESVKSSVFESYLSDEKDLSGISLATGDGNVDNSRLSLPSDFKQIFEKLQCGLTICNGICVTVAKYNEDFLSKLSDRFEAPPHLASAIYSWQVRSTQSGEDVFKNKALDSPIRASIKVDQQKKTRSFNYARSVGKNAEEKKDLVLDLRVRSE